MDLRHLRYFIAVAEEENIGRAANRLHISQPPLTRQIQQLEDELGVRLFRRTPKGMELTQAGELFLEEARNIRAVVEQATERTQRAGQGKLGRIGDPRRDPQTAAFVQEHPPRGQGGAPHDDQG